MSEFIWSEGGENYSACLEIRIKVFVDEQGYSVEEEIDAYDQTALHCLMLEDGVPIGCGRCIDAGNGLWKLGRIAVLPKWRMGGYGAKLVQEMERECISRGATSFDLSAQVRASGFYRRCGYREYGEEYMDGHVVHISMSKDI